MTQGRIDVMAALAALPEAERAALIRSLHPAERQELAERWDGGWARAGQMPPAGEDWRVWLIRAGRGFGKTRAGAEWVTAIAAADAGAEIALVGATAADVRRVGDQEAAVEAAIVVTGRSVAPPAPVHASAIEQADGGVALRWTRRSRAGWAWADALDAPLGEEVEAYRVTLTGSDGTSRLYDVVAPQLVIPSGDRPIGPSTVAIVQRGTLALSPPVLLSLS